MKRSFLGSLLPLSLFAAFVLPVGCAADAVDSGGSASSEGNTGSAGQAFTSPPLCYWDYAPADLDTVTTNARAAGYVPISLSAYGNPTAPRFAAVFAKRAGAAFKVLHGVGNSSFQAAFNAQAAAGYKPSLVSFDGTAGNPVWGAVFVATTTGIPLTRFGLVSSTDWTNSGSIEYWMQYATTNHLIPSTVSIYGTAASPVYSIVLEPNTNNVAWSLGQTYDPYGNVSYEDNQTSAEYQAFWNALVPAGDRVGIIDLNQDEHYVSMFRDDSIGAFAANHGMSRTDLGTQINAQAAAGRYPISIQAGGDGANAKFAAIFAQTDLPLPKAWTATGSTHALDTAIPTIDAAMEGFMSRHDVRQASLAVLDGKKLAYARGYSLEEAGLATTSPTSTFRLASVTKTFTAMEIMHLVDRGQLLLSDKVQDILHLKTYTGAAPDPLFGTITIQNLLQHNFPSLTVAGTPHCLLRDPDISQAAATTLGVSLPVTRTEAISLAMASPWLVTRDASQGCYSNFGYQLLGQVIEARRGMPVYSAMQTDILGPLSITHYHLGSGDVSNMPAGDPIYRSNLFVAPNIEVPGTPIGQTAYVQNFDAMAASGGLSVAATDVARLLSALGIGAGNPIYQHAVSTRTTPSTVSQILQGAFGFDDVSNDAWGNTHYYKGGFISGIQTSVSFVNGGRTYVLLWARDDLNGLTGADDWAPHWGTLETAIHDATFAGRPDLFPQYGMPSL